MSPSIFGLGMAWPMASREARREKTLWASFPQLPYVSTARGIHVHPNSWHLVSLATCFLIIIIILHRELLSEYKIQENARMGINAHTGLLLLLLLFIIEKGKLNVHVQPNY